MCENFNKGSSVIKFFVHQISLFNDQLKKKKIISKKDWNLQQNFLGILHPTYNYHFHKLYMTKEKFKNKIYQLLLIE